MNFDELVATATDNTTTPYPYQAVLANDGLPELLEVPTGAGKTMAAVLPWLYRRRHHPDFGVRATTPHWLVYALPMRALVEQTEAAIRSWLDRIYPEKKERPGLHLLMGGERFSTDDWRLHPERDAIFVGTIDMIVSRAINRGYGESRWSWPIDFGLFNNGCQWVFDEVQLMGASLPTSRQLHGLRHALGTAQPCQSMWMSATVDLDTLLTVDAPHVASHHRLGENDLATGLRERIEASKRVKELKIDSARYATGLAAAVVEAHSQGTRTIVFCNTVDRATEVFTALRKATEVPSVLVHSRFRPDDRKRAIDAAIDTPDPTAGCIVVTTQVLEAGVDITSATLITEVAPWASVVQRAGRCNRYGTDQGAQLLWVEPPKPLPYEADDLAATAKQLQALEGESVTAASLPEMNVAMARPIHAVLRRRDLLDLFDTTPDLTGNDIDVSRFVRDADGTDIDVVWRDDKPTDRRDRPARAERCKVPIGEMKALDGRSCWRLDPIAGSWIECRRSDIRPGDTIVVTADQGGYDPLLGWAPKSRTKVEPILPTIVEAAEPLSEEDVVLGDDPLTTNSTSWMSLTQHLREVEAAATSLSAALQPVGLSPDMLDAAIAAARLHDIGKAHPVFQEMLRTCATTATEEQERDAVDGPWAKSGGTGRGKSPRKHFRHELASALALLGEGAPALDGVAERDLAIYLVAAHHGRVRVGFRPIPGETADAEHQGRAIALGVIDGETLDPVETPAGTVPSATLSLSFMALGATETGERSWTARALSLRDRDDLGPFRLAYLEAMVRLADWQASSTNYRAEVEAS